MGDVMWIDLAQDRNRWRALANAVMNLRVPEDVDNFLTSWEPVTFSSRALLCGVSKYASCIQKTNRKIEASTLQNVLTFSSFVISKLANLYIKFEIIN
jgi:hypothetical protein